MDGEVSGIDPDLVRRARIKVGEFYYEVYTGPKYGTSSENDTGPEDEEALADEYEDELCPLMDIDIAE